MGFSITGILMVIKMHRFDRVWSIGRAPVFNFNIRVGLIRFETFFKYYVILLQLSTPPKHCLMSVTPVEPSRRYNYSHSKISNITATVGTQSNDRFF